MAAVGAWDGTPEFGGISCGGTTVPVHQKQTRAEKSAASVPASPPAKRSDKRTRTRTPVRPTKEVSPPESDLDLAAATPERQDAPTPDSAKSPPFTPPRGFVTGLQISEQT